MLGGNHPNDTMKSLGYTGIVIERTNCVPTEIEDFPSSCSPLVPRKIQWTCWPKNCLIPHVVWYCGERINWFEWKYSFEPLRSDFILPPARKWPFSHPPGPKWTHVNAVGREVLPQPPCGLILGGEINGFEWIRALPWWYSSYYCKPLMLPRAQNQPFSAARMARRWRAGAPRPARDAP